MIGFGFAAHGYAKLSRGLGSFGGVLQTIGIPQPHLVAWVTAFTEFIGDIGLMAGAFWWATIATAQIKFPLTEKPIDLEVW